MVFEQEEQPALLVLCGERFDVPVWAQCKVHPDHHIRFKNALDPLPTCYVGKQVEVKGTRALVRLSAEQAHDFCEIVSERYERASTILTSNRHITEWVTLFDDQILANSALDRLAHNAHQMVVEGESYRKKKASARSFL